MQPAPLSGVRFILLNDQMDFAGNDNLALVAVGSRPHPKSLFGRLLTIGALPLPSTIDVSSRAKRSQPGVTKYISDRELRKLQLPCILAALLPTPAPLRDRAGDGSIGSHGSHALPVQQQALVVRGAASLVLQQWLLLAADVVLLLRRLLRPEKQLHRHDNEGHEQQHVLTRQQQQQDVRRKRIRTVAADTAENADEHQEPDETAEAMWARAMEMQEQQRREDAEGSQQRLKTLGSVFALRLQAAEASVVGSRDSSSMLLQRGAPDLFSACWNAVATPLRSGSSRPAGRLTPSGQEQQVGSHERLLAAAVSGEAHAPGMSWKRWAFGGHAPPPQFSSAAAAESDAAVNSSSSAAAAAADSEGAAEQPGAHESEVVDFGDMWGPLPEDELPKQDRFLVGDQQEGVRLVQGDAWSGFRASRRRGGHLVQLDSAICRSAARGCSGGREQPFPSLLRASSVSEEPPRSRVAVKCLTAAAADKSEIYGLHPVACLYRCLQQQLLQFASKGGCAAWTAPAAGGTEERATTLKGHGGARRASGAPLGKGPLSANAAAAGVEQTGWQQAHQATGEEAAWQRGDDFTLYTEPGQRQQQQQPEDSTGDRRSGDLLGSSEYVEVLRGIFDSSSMHQRATQTRLTQLPRESDGSSTSRVGDSRRTSAASSAASEASFEGLAFGDFPEFDGCGYDAGEDPHQQQQQQEHIEAHGAAVASLRLRELLHQYAQKHNVLPEHFDADSMKWQQQQQRQRGKAFPLSKLLPKGRIDQRTACCTFSHLLLLHTHGSIKLEQQEQVLPMPASNQYPEVYVRITGLWEEPGEAEEGQQHGDQPHLPPNQHREDQPLQQHEQPRQTSNAQSLSDPEDSPDREDSNDWPPKRQQEQRLLNRGFKSAGQSLRSERQLTTPRAS